MKHLLLVPLAFLFLSLASPTESHAQCPANADQNSCFTLPSGPCVSFPNGKLRVWVARPIIQDAKTYFDPHFGLSMRQLMRRYYVSGAMSITYLGGSWADGQDFRVQLQDCVVIVTLGDQ
ncbi:MAG: hypothetical protein AAF570_22920 [Bacteroidota bacterium]